MTGPRFTITPLGNADRTTFASGSDPLDRYFRSQVSQDIRRRVSACYVAAERATALIAGFYTLSAAAIPLSDLPPDLARKVPRYPSLPVARIGRLAVDQRFRGIKLGSVLLLDGATRAAGSDVAVFAIVVDAKDEDAAAFYRHHGFVAYGSAPLKLIAPLSRLLS